MLFFQQWIKLMFKAETDKGIVMSIEHKAHKIYGIMWQPEREKLKSKVDKNLIKYIFMFKAIILAIGRGSRMGDMTSLMPKCRTLFKGKDLIEWQIESLNNKFIDELAIVTGYLSETFDLKFVILKIKIGKIQIWYFL